MAQAPPADRVRQLIRQRLADRRMSLAELSLGIGRNHAYFQQFLERGVPREIPEKIRPALAALLEVDEGALRADGPPAPAAPIRVHGDVGALRGGMAHRRDLPVYAAARGGPTGMQVTPEPIDWVSRPHPLANVDRAFAVYLVGDSMDPAYRHGDLVMVHPALPALRGDDVLLTKHGADREMAAMVKHLVGWNERHWKVKQWNPEREFHMSRDEWQQAQVIVGKYNRR